MLKSALKEPPKTAQILVEKFKLALDFASNVTPKMIADRCDVTPQAVSGWRKTGRLDKRNVQIVAELTGTSVDWWLDGSIDSPVVPTDKHLSPRRRTTMDSVQEQLGLYSGDPAENRLIAALKQLTTADQEHFLGEMEERAARNTEILKELNDRKSPAAAAFKSALSDKDVERRFGLKGKGKGGKP